MTQVYLVRHAEPDLTVKDDSIRPLTSKGLLDSQRVTRALWNENITAVFSSPYKRTVDTIKDFAEKKDLEIRIIDDFRERRVDTGWIEDYQSFAKQQWADFNYRRADGECLKEVQERNIEALLDILRGYEGQSLLVGTHGTALSTMIHYFNPAFGYEDFERIRPIMPYILCFRFEGLTFRGMGKIEI